MKKAIVSVVIIGASALYIFMRTPASAAVLPSNEPTTVATAPTPSATSSASAPPSPSGSSAGASGSASKPPAANTGTAAAPPPPTPTGKYKDGSYTGSTVDAYYGYVQVKAVVSGGKIADVQFLSYPNDRGTSRYINSQAMPYLKQEALAVQDANVNIISGATDTSLAFRKSLGDALAKAINS